jgi:DNA-nicking Smr family endonuclease
MEITMAKFDSPQSGIIEVDVHGMTKRQAWAVINQKLNTAGYGVYRVRVIHGFHGGTELRNMVRRDFKNHPKVKRIEVGLNPGDTDLIIRELF